MSIFVCPICKAPLTKDGKSYKCEANHCFDTAKAGYVNLLPANKMNSKTPGDGKEMVSARRDFLNKGYYEPFRKKLTETALSLSLPDSPVYFDAGCGTGYYTKGIFDALESRGISGGGVDISKFAAAYASKEEKRGEFAVAGVYDLPLQSESIDLITNIFSPMADREYFRILKHGGWLLYAVPAPKHLFSLKALIYDKPYENAESVTDYDGFKLCGRLSSDFLMKFDSAEDLEALFSMTPYYWRTPDGALQKIRASKGLEVEASFYILIYQKI